MTTSQPVDAAGADEGVMGVDCPRCGPYVLAVNVPS